MSAAFGKNYKPFGLMDQRQTFALTDLADAITWAGLGIGVANNDYPHVIVKLSGFSKLIDIAPENCLYLGDDKRDMEAANAANMQGFIAQYGYIDPGSDLNSWQAAGRVQTPLELLRYIET